MDDIADVAAFVLQDRRILGSKANLVHIAVGPRGVFVIDTKFHKGRVEKREKSGSFSTDWRLFVGSRDCSRLVTGLAVQALAVETAASDLTAAQGGSVTPVLCFVDADWTQSSDGFDIQGVKVVGPERMSELVREPGPLGPEASMALAAGLADRLPAA
jgi:hypothetical protein